MTEKSGLTNLPKHVAIIMDGNGRWAKKRLLTKNAGHKAGAQALDKLATKMSAEGFECLTVYAFSTENWRRSSDEVAGLMALLRSYIQQYIDDNEKNNMRICVIGDVSALDDDLRQKIAYLEDLTRENGGMRVNIAMNYGGRDEITRCVKKIAEDAAAGRIAPEDVDEAFISARLDTAGLYDPDLLIRTSGEMRLSNFLPWQLVYTELWFCDKLWPDFTFDDLMSAVKRFDTRERRFGARKNESNQNESNQNEG